MAPGAGRPGRRSRLPARHAAAADAGGRRQHGRGAGPSRRRRGEPPAVRDAPVGHRHVPAVRLLVSAWGLLQRNNGTLYAAAITYFSFLALFPLLLLAVSVVAFALNSDPALQHSVYEHVAQRFPGRLGTTVHDAIQTA